MYMQSCKIQGYLYQGEENHFTYFILNTGRIDTNFKDAQHWSAVETAKQNLK